MTGYWADALVQKRYKGGDGKVLCNVRIGSEEHVELAEAQAVLCTSPNSLL